MPFELVIRGGTVVNGAEAVRADVGISDGKIVAVGELNQAADQTVDVTGLHVLPGLIDTQVHFREPGMEHKEDLESGTRAAVCGGVTTVFEMPNTNPPTTSQEALADKLRRAEGRAWCDYAFFVGAATDNVDQLNSLECLPGTPGIKVFVGSSTGSLLVPNDEMIEAVFANTKRRTPIHSEDYYRLEARKELMSPSPHVGEHPYLRDAECARLSTERVLRLAEKTRHPVHILHLSTAEEIPLIGEFRARHPELITVEVTPQHLWFEAPGAYDRLGSLVQMNPPIRSGEHRAALRQALLSGFFDVFGSDHAPHTLEEKALPYPKSPSGMPGVQTLLPALLTLAQRDGLFDLTTLVRMGCENPAKLFGLADKGTVSLGYDADLVIVDLDARWIFQRSMVQSKCGWSPFEAEEFWGRPVATILRGGIAMQDGLPVGSPRGASVRFDRG